MPATTRNTSRPRKPRKTKAAREPKPAPPPEPINLTLDEILAAPDEPEPQAEAAPPKPPPALPPGMAQGILRCRRCHKRNVYTARREYIVGRMFGTRKCSQPGCNGAARGRWEPVR